MRPGENEGTNNLINQLKNAMRVSLASAVLATSAVAQTSDQTVTLTSLDQTIRILGQLEGFDGTNYTIKTSLGTLVVNSAQLSCEGEACPYIKPPTSEFAVAGASSMSELLMPELVSAYSGALQAAYSETEDDGDKTLVMTDIENDDIARIQIVSSSSSSGLADLLQGDASIALSSRPVRRREINTFAASDLGNLVDPSQEVVVALDGLLIVTHPDNPVRAISEPNAALVFSGRIRNWSELGGPDAPITLYVRGADSGTSEVFNSIIMRPQGLQLQANASVLGSDKAVSDAVARDPFGIGFTSFVSRSDAKALAIEGVCGLQTPPSEFTIKTEEYPLTRRLFMYRTAGDAPLHVQEFLDFVVSDAAQTAVSSAGFVNQEVTQASVNSQGLRFASAIVANRNAGDLPQLRQMVGGMLSSDRLSTTFRFNTGSSQLDNRALGDVGRLASILAQPTYNNKIVQLVGFTDSVGNPFLNRQLSERRAQQVQAALLQADPGLTDRVTIETLGYGEISPLGCNETLAGRNINRRVEVWVRENTARLR